MSYGTRLLNLLEIVDDRGYRTLICPTDPEEMRTEILRRRDALRGRRQ